jgi:D-methionine transport system substrate-binding protein
MKKLLVFLSVLLVLLLAACGADADNDTSENDSAGDAETTEDQATEETESVEITIGASSTPHSEILEEARPLLEEEGITLNIEEYQDYVFPNDDLASGELDANYFQHIPFLNQAVSDTGYDLDYIDGIHVEPMGVYSQGIASVDDIPDGTEVIISNSVADHGRILALFESEGLITLPEGADPEELSLDDIEDNPKNLTFSPDVDPAFLPEQYFAEEDALIAINTNYAIDADLNPLEDALFIEGEDSPYVNVIGVRTEDMENEALNKLVEVLQSEEIQNFILENYNGAVVPVGGSN